MKRAFTLIELLVVMAIIVILAAAAVPAIKSLNKNTGEAQAVNQVRSMLSSARAIAVSQHRMAGVVFFEETQANAGTAYTNQTAMQIIVEDPSQYYPTYTPAPAQGNTVFVQDSQRSFLPAGIQLGTLCVDDATGFENINTAQGSGYYTMRAAMYNADGHMVVMTGVCRPDAANSMYNAAQLDWHLSDPAIAPVNAGNANLSGACSASAFVVYNKTDYAAQSFANDSARTIWLEQHANVVVINAYTGGVIR